MSLAISIDVSDNATPAIERKMAKCSPRRLATIIGQPCETMWRDRLAGLGENKMGWPSTHFYERAARSVTHIPSENSVTIQANQIGLRQRWLGGPIAPVNGKYLTIPISPVSYGKTAADFPGLTMVVTKKGMYLVQVEDLAGDKAKDFNAKKRGLGGNSSRRLRASLNFLFKLVASVNQIGNPQVVPTNDEFAEVALGAIEEAIK